MTDEKIFRHWHDDDLSFHAERQIFFSRADMNHCLSISEIMKATSDVAVEDYNARSMSWQFLQDNGVGILVSRMALRFHEFPQANDVVTVSTWEEKPEPLQLRRAYELHDRDGKKFVSGMSSWLLVDLKTNRIMRTKDFNLRPQIEKQTECDCLPVKKIIVPENMVELGERTIRFSDIDGNGHVNNSRYAEYALDSLPENLQKIQFSDFRINFSKEAKLGETLTIFGKFDESAANEVPAAKKITVVGKKTDEICFECEFFYKENL